MKKDFNEFNKVYIQFAAFYTPKNAYRLAVQEMKRRERNEKVQ